MTKTIRNTLTLAAVAAATNAANAQVQMHSVSDFRDAAGYIVAILLIVAFVSCLVLWLVGTMSKEQHPATAKWCFTAVWYVGIGLPVISLIFYLLVGSNAVVQPKF